MNRRDFLSLSTAAAAAPAWPLAVLAQQAAKVPHIVVLSLPQTDDRLEVLAQALADAGYGNGKTATIDTLIARVPDTDTVARQTLALKPDLIITSGSPAPIALKALGTTTPIVFANIVDPVALGLVNSYARPGGTMTGSMQGSPDVVGKQFEILREIIPSVKRVAVFGDPTDPPYGPLRDQTLAAGGKFGIDILPVDIAVDSDLVASVDTVVTAGGDAIFAELLALINTDMPTIASLAVVRKLPVIGSAPQARQGALVGYSGNVNEIVRQAATYVDAILKGSKPADLPIYQPSMFDFVINQKTAKAIGVTISPSLMVQATEVIS